MTKEQKQFPEKSETSFEESVFKVIMHALAFKSLKWQGNSGAFIEIVGNVSDVVIAGNDKMFTELMAKLTNKSLDEYKKQLAAKRKLLNDNIKSIPTRVDEVSRNTPASLDFEQLKTDKAILVKSANEIQSQIDDKTKAFDEILKRRNAVANEVYELKSKLQNIEFETKQTVGRSIQTRTSEVDNLTKELATKKGELQSYESGLISLKLKLQGLELNELYFTKAIAIKRVGWETENAKQLNFENEHFACPTCKRDFEASDVEAKKTELQSNFIKKQNENLVTINAEAKSLAYQRVAVDNEISGLQIRIKHGNERVNTTSLTIINNQ